MMLALLREHNPKTQPRRLVKPGKYQLPDGEGYRYNGDSLVREVPGASSIYPLPPCPYGRAGDRLWVRESVLWVPEHDNYYFAADRHGVGTERYEMLRAAGKNR